MDYASLRMNGCCLGNPSNMDCLLTLPRLRDGVGGLHPHQGVHFYSERLLDAERHIARKISLAVKQAGQGRAGNLECCCCSRYREACGLDNLCPNKISGMGRVLHGHGVYSFYPSGSLPSSHLQSLARRCLGGTGGGGGSVPLSSTLPARRRSPHETPPP